MSRIELVNADTRYAAAYDAKNLKRLSEDRQELGASAVRQRQKTVAPRSYISLAEAAAVARRLRPGDIAVWKLQGRETGRVQYEFSVHAPGASRTVNVQLNAEGGTVIAIS